MEARDRPAGVAAPNPASLRDGSPGRRLGRVLIALTADIPLPPPPPSSDRASLEATRAEAAALLPENTLLSLHRPLAPPPSALGGLPPGSGTGATRPELPGSGGAQPRSAVRPVGAHAAAAGGAAVEDRVAWGGQAAPLDWYAAGVEAVTVVVEASWGADDTGTVPGARSAVPEQDFLAEEEGGVASAARFVMPDLSGTMIIEPEGPGGRRRALPLSRVTVSLGLQASVAPPHLGDGDAPPLRPPGRGASTVRGEDLTPAERSVLAAAPVTWSADDAAELDIDLRVAPERGSAISPVRSSGGAAPSRVEAPVLMALRLVPSSMADTPMPFPLAVPARAAFDSSVIGDVEESTGVPAHRLTVLSAHAGTGIVVIRCVGALDTSEASCAAAKDALQAAISDAGSALHKGVVGFNADPLFPSGRGEVTKDGGFIVVDGACSDPSRLTEKECLSVGSCSCTDVRRNNQNRCERSSAMSGQPCQFSPDNQWTPGRRKVRVAGCSDPRHRTKDACLAAGRCADGSGSSRDECLAAGVCLPPQDKRSAKMNTVGRPVFDFTEFRTRQECVDPRARSPPSGRCTTAPGTNDPIYPCYRHRDELTCEEPPHRRKLPGAHACVRRPGGVPFDYEQFRDRAACEQPETRDCPAVARRHEALFGDPGRSGVSRPFFFLQAGARTASGRGGPSLVDAEAGDLVLTAPPAPSQPSMAFPPEDGVAPTAADARVALDRLGALGPGEVDAAASGGGDTAAVRGAVTESRGRPGGSDAVGFDGERQLPGQIDGDDSAGASEARTSTGSATDGASAGMEDRGPPPPAAGSAGLPPPPGSARPRSPSAAVTRDGSDCGPAGIWAPTTSLVAKGPVCIWSPEENTAPCRFGRPPPCLPDSDKDELQRQKDDDPGEWATPNDFASTNDWKQDGSSREEPCPCEWPRNKYHLKKCNWWKCGPSAQVSPLPASAALRLVPWPRRPLSHAGSVRRCRATPCLPAACSTPPQGASAQGQLDYYRQKSPNEVSTLATCRQQVQPGPAARLRAPTSTAAWCPVPPPRRWSPTTTPSSRWGATSCG